MRKGTQLTAYVLGAACALVALPWIGAERITIPGVLASVQGEQTAAGLIFFHQRIPRVLVGMLVGGTLAATGASLQVLFRNPLAEPWTLGVSGGAAVGAFAACIVPAMAVSLGPLSATQIMSFAGAGLALLLVYGFSRQPHGMSTHTLLLGGITISILSGGLIMLMSYFVSPTEFLSFQRWTMGGVDIAGYGDLLSLAALAVPALAGLFSRIREFNHLALGDDIATGHGVNVLRTQRMTLACSALATAAVVSVSGPIGFVGMLIPHAVRALSGVDHRIVLPGSFLLGGTALAVCDTLARTVIAPTELPVGIITAVVGAPLFLAILASRKR